MVLVQLAVRPPFIQCRSPNRANVLTTIGPAATLRVPVLVNLLKGPALVSPTLAPLLTLGITQRQPAPNYPPTVSVPILLVVFRHFSVTVKQALSVESLSPAQCLGTTPNNIVALNATLQKEKLPDGTKLSLAPPRNAYRAPWTLPVTPRNLLIETLLWKHPLAANPSLCKDFISGHLTTDAPTTSLRRITPQSLLREVVILPAVSQHSIS